MRKIAIYDLDRTILKTPTFTAFLIFAARRRGRSLIWRAPVWIGALIGYKLRLYARKPLKQFGIALFIGRWTEQSAMDELARQFAADVVPADVQPGAAQAIAQDRASGYRLVIATAAPEFYVRQIAERLSFDDYLATRHICDDGRIGHRIDGENCYGAEKLRRVKAWLEQQDADRAACEIIAYSDHISDAPLLDWADTAMCITSKAGLAAEAEKRGWRVADFAVTPH